MGFLSSVLPQYESCIIIYIWGYKWKIGTQYVLEKHWKFSLNYSNIRLESGPHLTFQNKPSQINKTEDASGFYWLLWYWDCILIVDNLTLKV